MTENYDACSISKEQTRLCGFRIIVAIWKTIQGSSIGALAESRATTKKDCVTKVCARQDEHVFLTFIKRAEKSN